jgi:hypothetical protein
MAELLRRLTDARRPVDLPAQPVHGDLLGNVLFAENQPPAVIDWPVYFRPALWAQAVAVVDALTWCGAPEELLGRGSDHPAWGQMLIRALIYRIATNEGFRRINKPVRERPQDYQPVVDLVLRRPITAYSIPPQWRNRRMDRIVPEEQRLPGGNTPRPETGAASPPSAAWSSTSYAQARRGRQAPNRTLDRIFR